MAGSLPNVRWLCTWRGNRIDVARNGKNIGSYDLLQEPFCRRCSRPGVDEKDCGFHWFLDDALKRIYSVSTYYTSLNSRTNLMTKHVLSLKNSQGYATPVAQAMALTVKKKYAELLDADLIVPVPLHADKKAQRGFDQAEELGRLLGCLLRKPFANPIVKTRNESIHSIRQLPEKMERVKGLYSCSESLKRKRILLIDDIATSGLDLGECAKVLRQSGALQINALVAGRTVFRY